MLTEIPQAGPDTLWLSVVGSDGKFEVSDRGEIRKTTTGELVKLTANDRGYLCCGVVHGGVRKVRKVHIMVAEAFIGPRPEGQELAFGDGVKSNCRLFNLSYATPKKHAEDRIRNGTVPPSAKLTAAEVIEMRKLISARVRFNEIAARYGVSYGTVKKVSSRLTWDHL